MSYTLSNWDGSQSKKSGSKKPTESSTNMHSSVSIQKSLNLDQTTNLVTTIPSHTAHFLGRMDLPATLDNAIPTLVHYDTVWFDASNTHNMTFGRPGPVLDPPVISHGLDTTRINDSVRAADNAPNLQDISFYQQRLDPEAPLLPIITTNVDSNKLDDRVEGMSVFSAEAEAEDDNGEDDASLEMPVDYVPQPAPSPEGNVSMRERLQNVYNLFTPSPVPNTVPLPNSSSLQILDPPRAPAIQRTRHIMSYVDVPPLPKGFKKSSYQPSKKKGVKKFQKSSAQSVHGHSDLAAAMEASFKGNREIGSLPSKQNAVAGPSKIPPSLHYSKIARKRRVDDEESDFVPVTKKSKSKSISAKGLDDNKKKSEARKRILVKPKDRLNNDAISVVSSRPKNNFEPKSILVQSNPLRKGRGRPPKPRRERIEYLLKIEDEMPFISSSVYILNARYIRHALDQANGRPWLDIVAGCEPAEEDQQIYSWLSAADSAAPLLQPDDDNPPSYFLGSWPPSQIGSDNECESDSVVDITDQMLKKSTQNALNQRPQKNIPGVDSFQLHQTEPMGTPGATRSKQASFRRRSNSAIIPETEDSYSPGGDDNEIEIVARPSAKALGKRKASSHTIYSVPDSPAASFQHSPPPDLLPIDGEPYLGDLEASQHHAHDFYSEFTLEDILNNSHPNDYAAQHLQSPIGREPLQPHYESTLSDNHHNNIFKDLDYEASWIPSGHEISYDTIDPTLLGGGLDMPQTTDHQETYFSPLSLRVDREPSPAPSSSSSNSSKSSASGNLVTLPIPVDSPLGKRSASPVISKRRVRRQRQHPDMIPIASVSLDLDSASGSASDNDIDGTYAGGGGAVVKKSLGHRGSRPASGIKSDTKVTSPAKQGKRSAWATGGYESYCHQCRTKSAKLKMVCDCGKHYCNRCIAIRYPNLVFGLKFHNSSCPACEGNCNCDICCRKRGETFVSSKKPSQASATPLPPFLQVSIDPVTYWGVVYSLEGEKIANAYVGADGNEDVVVACPVKIIRRLPRKRVFVGTIRPSWGFGRNPTVTEYKLDPPPKTMKRKLKSTLQPVRTRFYVGNPSPLFLPFRPDELEVDDYFGKEFGSSPLSSLDSDMEEEVASFSPDSLGDVDVSRAINLALHSLQS